MNVDRRTLLAVALGGAAGASARYELGLAFPDGGGFPWTTLAINVSGCFAIGILVAGVDVWGFALARPLIGTGFLGGFTTFSTYANQTRELFQDGRPWVAVSYVLATLLAALPAVWLGLRSARWVLRRRLDRG